MNVKDRMENLKAALNRGENPGVHLWAPTRTTPRHDWIAVEIENVRGNKCLVRPLIAKDTLGKDTYWVFEHTLKLFGSNSPYARIEKYIRPIK